MRKHASAEIHIEWKDRCSSQDGAGPLLPREQLLDLARALGRFAARRDLEGINTGAAAGAMIFVPAKGKVSDAV